MTYGPTLGALVTTTFARSAPPRHPSRPSRRGRLARRIVAVGAAVVVAVTLVVAMGLAPSAGARPITAPPSIVANTVTADQPPQESAGPHLSGLREMDQPLKESAGPHLSGLRPAAAAIRSESSGLPWGVVAIGSGVALGLIALAISAGRSRKRTGPAALSH